MRLGIGSILAVESDDAVVGVMLIDSSLRLGRWHHRSERVWRVRLPGSRRHHHCPRDQTVRNAQCLKQFVLKVRKANDQDHIDP